MIHLHRFVGETPVSVVDIHGFMSTAALLHAKRNSTLEALKCRFGGNRWAANPFHICDILSVHVWGWSLESDGRSDNSGSDGNRATFPIWTYNDTVLSNCSSILSPYFPSFCTLVWVCSPVHLRSYNYCCFIILQVSHSFSFFFMYYYALTVFQQTCLCCMCLS